LKLRGLIIPAYGVGVTGAFLQVAGANWDVSSHILGIVDTFFTPPHLVLYVGILLVLIAGILGVWMVRQRGTDEQLGSALTGLKVAFAGSMIQLVAGPLDLWWHELYGFDPYLFTPTHSMLIIGLALGGIGMAIGVMRLLQSERRTRVLKLLGVVSLGTVWLDTNFLFLWGINAHGIAYTFRICSPTVIEAGRCAFVGSYDSFAYLPALFLDASGGAIMFFLAKRLLGWRGALLSAAAIVAAVNAAAVLGFSAYMLLFFSVPGSFYFTGPTSGAGASLASIISFYLALLVPVALIDILVQRDDRRALIVASLVVGPLTVFLDGRFSTFSGLWSPGPETLVYLLPMALGGLLGGGLGRRVVGAVVARRVDAMSGGRNTDMTGVPTRLSLTSSEQKKRKG
jgi:hypothetical protein